MAENRRGFFLLALYNIRTTFTRVLYLYSPATGKTTRECKVRTDIISRFY